MRSIMHIQQVWPRDTEHAAHLVIARQGLGPYAPLQKLYTRNDFAASLCERAKYHGFPVVITSNDRGTILHVERMDEEGAHEPVQS